jgi:hypothetical protein
MDPLLSNAVHIARYRSKNPLPARSRDDVTSAYGAQEMVKLTRLLRHEETMTRDQALVALQSALQKPQLRASGVHAGLVPALQVRPRRPPRPCRPLAPTSSLLPTSTCFRRCALHVALRTRG